MVAPTLAMALVEGGSAGHPLPRPAPAAADQAAAAESHGSLG